jgi:hypothetical protein
MLHGRRIRAYHAEQVHHQLAIFDIKTFGVIGDLLYVILVDL